LIHHTTRPLDEAFSSSPIISYFTTSTVLRHNFVKPTQKVFSFNCKPFSAFIGTYFLLFPYLSPSFFYVDPTYPLIISLSALLYFLPPLPPSLQGSNRRKIRLIEGNAKCRHQKKLPMKGRCGRCLSV
jgi:hypothetical protein